MSFEDSRRIRALLTEEQVLYYVEPMCSWPCIVMLYFRRSMLCFMTWRYRCCWFFFAFAFIFERDCSFHLTKLLSLHLKQLNNGKWLLIHNVFPGNSLCGWRCGWAWLCLFCFCIVIDLHRSFWQASKRLLLCLKPRCKSSPVHCLRVCCIVLFLGISQDIYVDMGVLFTSGINSYITSLSNVFWHPPRDRALP